MDLDLFVEGKEAELNVMGALILRLRVRHGIACGDFNVQRSVRGLVDRAVGKGHALEMLHAPYNRDTNWADVGGHVAAIEVHYFLCSRHLQPREHHMVPAVSTHGMLVAGVVGLQGVPVSPVVKRYRHRAVMPLHRADVCALLTLCWWWMRAQRCHPDAWLQCYWRLAEPILPQRRCGTACVRCTTEVGTWCGGVFR